jgi:hypothetical protein
MTRHASGVFYRNDRVPVAAGTTVRVLAVDRKQVVRAQLLKLGSSDLVLSALRPPALALGSSAQIAVTLPGRYIELELPGIVDWEDGATFGVRLDYLTARQAYGFALARELLAQPQKVLTFRRATQR